MASDLLKEFEDIEYKEYEDSGDVPFEFDGKLNEINGVVIPVHSTSEPPKPPGSLMVKKICNHSGNVVEQMDDQMKRAILREAKAHHHARHQHVVELFTAYYDGNQRPYMGIVMERADGDIGSYLDGQKPIGKTKQISGWFRCLASVIAYVHGMGIRHRDIKPPNILVKNGRVLLADFGISKLGIGITLPTTVPMMARARTPQYAAPEVNNGATRGRSADMFSLGAIYLEMLVAHSFPWKRAGLREAREVRNDQSDMSYGSRLEQVRGWMETLKSEMGDNHRWQRVIIQLCQNMLQEDRDERPSAEKVLSVIADAQIPDVLGTCRSCEPEEGTWTLDRRFVEACKSGRGDEVSQFLRDGVSPNTVGAIHQASANGREDIVNVLLSNSADVDMPDYGKQTALHYAAGWCHGNVVKLLLEKGAQANLQDDERRTPLHYASGHGYLEIVERLLEYQGEDTINMVDGNGQTALHFAARGKERSGSNHEKVIRLLLKKGADIHVRDQFQGSARDYAELKNHKGRADLLGNDAPGSILAPTSMLTGTISMMNEELAQIIQPPRQYTNSDIQKVCDRLKEFPFNWERTTKIYMVLTIMSTTRNVLELLDKFKEKKFTDYLLPFNRDDLATVLGPGDCAKFVGQQERVLSETFRFDKSNLREHYNLRTNEWRGNLEEIAELGQGAFGKVYKVKVRGSDGVYALKQIDRGVRTAEKELNILEMVKHPNIVSFIGSFTSPNYFGLLMEPAADHNLETYLREVSVDPGKKTSLACFFGCLANALFYLHIEANLRHNDIKPQNILVHGGRVFLSDFGISLDWKATLQTTTVAPTARTPLYCAPEVMHEGRPRNSSADIWSLGCVFLEMVTVLKGRESDSIRSYLREMNRESNSYSENLSNLQLWMKILEDDDAQFGNEPLRWIGDMLQQDPQSRLTAGNLREELRNHSSDSVSRLSFFGNCCRFTTSTSRELENTHLPDETPEEFPIEEHTRIATIGWPGEQRLYLQGTDGSVREATRSHHDSFWKGGKAQHTITIGKLCSPIAATAWQQMTGYRHPTVRVYVLDVDNHIRERAWDPISGWSDGALSAYRVKVAPFSELAVTSWGDGNLILCYQDEERAIRILHGWAGKSLWRHGSKLTDAAVGSPLTAINFEHLGNHAFRLYYCREGFGLREACWDKIEDEARADFHHYMGGYIRPAQGVASIAATATKEVEVEFYIYSSSPAGIEEWRYSGGWLPWPKHIMEQAPAVYLSTLRRGTDSVGIYFVRSGGVIEILRSSGNFTEKRILSSPACRGAECPHKAVPQESSAASPSTQSTLQPSAVQQSALQQPTKPSVSPSPLQISDDSLSRSVPPNKRSSSFLSCCGLRR